MPKAFEFPPFILLSPKLFNTQQTGGRPQDAPKTPKLTRDDVVTVAAKQKS